MGLQELRGDVMSDGATTLGSLAMMTSVLVSPTAFRIRGCSRYYSAPLLQYLKVKKLTNSVATLFAWTGALRKRGGLTAPSL